MCVCGVGGGSSDAVQCLWCDKQGEKTGRPIGRPTLRPAWWGLSGSSLGSSSQQRPEAVSLQKPRVRVRSVKAWSKAP
jgi:hypothetical protein